MKIPVADLFKTYLTIDRKVKSTIHNEGEDELMTELIAEKMRLFDILCACDLEVEVGFFVSYLVFREEKFASIIEK